MSKTADTQVSAHPSHYVGIGASAGGLEAIEDFFRHMRAECGLAFIVIQHLSPDYKSLMKELLSKKTDMTVHRAEDGMEVLANNVYLIPPKKNLTIFHGKLLLKDQDSSRGGINLPIDIFLRSLAEDQGERAVGIVLSGTGSDGTRGVRAIKEFGGMVMVQDEEDAKFDGMPRAAISTGVADFILPAKEMPAQLMAFVKHPYVSREHRSEKLFRDEDNLTRIFAELREKTKVDFTYYKPSTITRRIQRRMSVNQIDDIKDYVSYLQTYPAEIMTLYRELLIGVTSFFRDLDAMQELGRNWMPEVLKRARNREIRFWVPGCSSGEEAYTIAILAKEAMEQEGLSRDVKIFATDLDRDAILIAGNGVYPESIAADLTPKLLAKYFYLKDDHYQITRQIREMVVFARHNLIKDPPFTNIDLISCRNLLIYLQPILQQKALELFSFSLNPNGILFLGSSETIGDMTDVFEAVHQKFKIYVSKGKKQKLSTNFEAQSKSGRRGETPVPLPREHRRPAAQPEESRVLQQFLDVLADQYVALAVVVNGHMEIQHLVGNSEGFFKVPSGRAVYDITKMAAKDLAIPLATGVQKVFRTGEPIKYSNLRLRFHQEMRSVSLRILPFPERKHAEPLAAVLFEETTLEPETGIETEANYDLGEEAQQRIRDLEQELQFARENLQATIEELETSNEELQATNEELLASNEELQSTNEELQSTNEELHTVNAEYQNKINELTELNNDVDNLLTSSKIGKLFLDEELEIRKFSPEITKIFRIMDKDIGRPITHISHSLLDVDPVEMIRMVQQSSQAVEKEIQVQGGQWYLARILPYHIGPETFSGVVLTFVDITDLKKTQQELDSSLRTSRDIIRFMPSGLFLYRLDEAGRLVLESANPEAERLTGISTEAWHGRTFDEIWPRAEALGITERFHRILEAGERYYCEDVNYADDRLEGAYRIHAFQLPERRLAVSFEDITRYKQMSRDLQESERKYRTLFETMAQGVVYQDAEGNIVSANPSAERILGLNFEQMQGRTSRDPRWRAIREDGSDLPGEEHPSMLALRTGRPVNGFIMGVFNPSLDQIRWILVDAVPDFRPGEEKPFQVYTTFEDISEWNIRRPEFSALSSE